MSMNLRLARREIGIMPPSFRRIPTMCRFIPALSVTGFPVHTFVNTFLNRLCLSKH
jgi:hypothetical protein